MFNTTGANSIFNLNRTKLLMDDLLTQVQTGNRINKAADDSSGLTIADNLRSQANSLQAGTKNANDAKSLLDIADGALTAFKDTLGTMKDKAVASASDASNADSRNALQRDITALMKSLNNIADTTSFNGLKLLNGSFANKSFQVGAYANQTVGISLGSLNTNKIGHLTEVVTNTGVSAGTTAATLNINGTVIGQSTVSATNKDGANLVAEAINLKEEKTGVVAKATNTVNGTNVVGGNIANGDISINGVSIGALNINPNDSTGTLIDAINNITSQTGVSARIEAGSLVLNSANGENIHITQANAGAAKAGLTAGTNYGKIELSSSNNISVTNGDAISGLNATTTNNYTLSSVNVTTVDGAQKAMKIMDAALKEANRNAADVGSVTNQLDRTITVNDVTEKNVRAAESTIRGADISEIMDKLSSLQVNYQASTFALGKSNELQMNVLSLLR